MATTHVFIVDTTTFNVHLKYMFAGTGAKELSADILLSKKESINKDERLLAGLAADAARIRSGDYILFYLQQNKQKGVEEGLLFGIFQAEGRAFVDPTGKALKSKLSKKLPFRVFIRPYEVYAKGVSEWDLLDNIQGIKSPKEMIWSLIYRKLRGNRGNTMITLKESERVFTLLAQKNNDKQLKGKYFCWDYDKQQISVDKKSKYPYNFKQVLLDVKPRLIAKYMNSKRAFENLLQTLIVGNVETVLKKVLQDQKIDWIGNEVACGVGMQRIDILIHSHNTNGDIFIYPIELKDEPIKIDIFKQIKRYIAWLRLYYQDNKKQKIVPVIIAAASKRKSTITKSDFEQFNLDNKNHCQNLRYITFDKMLKFEEVDYKKI